MCEHCLWDLGWCELVSCVTVSHPHSIIQTHKCIELGGCIKVWTFLEVAIASRPFG